MEIEFINYTPYDEYNEYLNNLRQDEFNRSTIKYIPKVFNANLKHPDILECGKKKELELLNLELENISSKESENFDNELLTKEHFLMEKIKFLSNLSASQWKYNLGIVKNNVYSQVVSKKSLYTKKDILIIAKILLAVQKNKDVQNFEIMNSFVEIYLGKNPNIRIFFLYQNLFGCDTRNFLLKMLCYFVSLSKPDFISVALQTIDIFTNKSHSNTACELHKELLRNYDIKKYRQTYEQEESFGSEGNCETFFADLEKDIRAKLNEVPEKKTYKSKNDRNIFDTVVCEAKKYFNAKIKNFEYTFNVNEQIWKFSSINFGVKTNHWYIGDDLPEKAHSKYSEHISMEKFVKFIVDTKKLFHDREMQLKFANLPSL